VAGRDAEHVDEDGRRSRAWHGGHEQVLDHKVALASQGTQHSLTQTTLPVEDKENNLVSKGVSLKDSR